MWAAVPCTPWTKFQRLNLAKLGPDFAVKLAKQRRHSLKIVKNFTIAARAVLAKGGSVSFEWPEGCDGWETNPVKSFMKEFDMAVAHCHGCSMGVVSSRGVPMRKPWAVATTDANVFRALNQQICTKDHDHDPVEGQDTERSCYYPDEMCEIILKSLQSSRSCSNIHEVLALCSVLDELKEGGTELSHDHRTKQPESLLPHGLSSHLSCMGMVTKLITKSMPEWTSNEGQVALNAELLKLLAAGVWGNKPREWAEVRKSDPTAHVSRIFPILGIKGAEGPKISQKYKGRFVLQGSDIREANGQSAVFQDCLLYTSPSPRDRTRSRMPSSA